MIFRMDMNHSVDDSNDIAQQLLVRKRKRIAQKDARFLRMSILRSKRSRKNAPQVADVIHRVNPLIAIGN